MASSSFAELPAAGWGILRVAAIGRLQRHPTSSRDFLAEVLLDQVEPASLKAPKLEYPVCVLVPVGYAAVLITGSLWEDRISYAQSAVQPKVFSLKVGPAATTFVERRREAILVDALDASRRPFDTKRGNIEKPTITVEQSLLCVRAEGNVEVRIPCWEVLRAFYAPTSSLLTRLVTPQSGESLRNLLVAREPATPSARDGFAEIAPGHHTLRLADGLGHDEFTAIVAAFLLLHKVAGPEVMRMRDRFSQEHRLPLRLRVRLPVDAPLRIAVRGEWAEDGRVFDVEEIVGHDIPSPVDTLDSPDLVQRAPSADGQFGGGEGGRPRQRDAGAGDFSGSDGPRPDLAARRIDAIALPQLGAWVEHVVWREPPRGAKGDEGVRYVPSDMPNLSTLEGQQSTGDSARGNLTGSRDASDVLTPRESWRLAYFEEGIPVASAKLEALSTRTFPMPTPRKIVLCKSVTLRSAFRPLDTIPPCPDGWIDREVALAIATIGTYRFAFVDLQRGADDRAHRGRSIGIAFPRDSSAPIDVNALLRDFVKLGATIPRAGSKRQGDRPIFAWTRHPHPKLAGLPDNDADRVQERNERFARGIVTALRRVWRKRHAMP